MKKIYQLICILLIFGLWSAVFVACRSTPQQTVYRSIAVTQVSVDTIMKGWGTYVASGRATVAQEQVVKDAYEKYQHAFAAACDAGAAYAASSVTNSTGATGYKAALDYAIENANRALTDLQALVTSFGVKLVTS